MSENLNYVDTDRVKELLLLVEVSHQERANINWTAAAGIRSALRHLLELRQQDAKERACYGLSPMAEVRNALNAGKPMEQAVSEALPQLHREKLVAAVIRAAERLADNIAEFDTITDGDYLDALDSALLALPGTRAHARRQEVRIEPIRHSPWEMDYAATVAAIEKAREPDPITAMREATEAHQQAVRNGYAGASPLMAMVKPVLECEVVKQAMQDAFAKGLPQITQGFVPQPAPQFKAGDRVRVDAPDLYQGLGVIYRQLDETMYHVYVCQPERLGNRSHLGGLFLHVSSLSADVKDADQPAPKPEHCTSVRPIISACFEDRILMAKDGSYILQEPGSGLRGRLFVGCSEEWLTPLGHPESGIELDLKATGDNNETVVLRAKVLRVGIETLYTRDEYGKQCRCYELEVLPLDMTTWDPVPEGGPQEEGGYCPDCTSYATSEGHKSDCPRVKSPVPNPFDPVAKKTARTDLP